jgi:hypothetical protein
MPVSRSPVIGLISNLLPVTVNKALCEKNQVSTASRRIQYPARSLLRLSGLPGVDWLLTGKAHVEPKKRVAKDPAALEYAHS